MNMCFRKMILKACKHSQISNFYARNITQQFIPICSTKYAQIRTYARQASITQIAKPREDLPELSFADFDKNLLHNFEIDIPEIPVHSTSFADYMNSSETLQALVMLGVELFKIEKRFPEAMTYMVMLDLNSDVKPRLEYLLDIGILHAELAHMLTRNPKILDPNQSLIEMNELIQYFKDKKFKKDEMLSVIVRCPDILTIPVPKLDGILGFFQRLESHQTEKKIRFSNDELKSIILSCPRLIISDLYLIHEHIRTLQVSCEFTLSEIRQLILGLPSILIKDPKEFEKLFKYYIREMGYSNKDLVKFPEAFNERVQKIIERHSYLKYLERAIYKPEEPGYISLEGVYLGKDEIFCERNGLGNVLNFKKFLKTF